MRICWAIVLSSCALLLSGCAGVPVANTIENTSVQGAALQGRVHGGQNPIAGAHVYLYAFSNKGYGSASISLLNNVSGVTTVDGSGNYYVTTDSNGNFTITGDYTCLTATPLTYVYAVGGNPGSGNNSAATLFAGVGDCTHSGYTSKYVVVNEVSTIVGAYAAAGYIVDPTHVSTSPTTLSQTDFSDALKTGDNLDTQSTGVALATTPAGNGTVPQSEINTLANILGACVNSVNTTVSPSTECTTLFSNAKNGSTTPTDTATAAINIAHNPGANIANLYGLQTASAPFQPSLSAAPNDFTIAISYTGGGMDTPWGIAVDGSGNIWLANTGSSNSISEFTPYGAPVTGSPFSGGGLNQPEDVAVDPSGNIWVTNPGSGTTGTISEFTTAGRWVSASGFSGGGLNSPVLLAIDKSGNVWVTNGNNSISELSSGGSPLSGLGFTGNGQLVGPAGIAIDIPGNVWVANSAFDSPSESSISEFNSSGTAVSGSPFTGSGLYQPQYLAIDASGNVWTTDNDYSGNPPAIGGLSEFSSSGTAKSGTGGYTGGGLDAPIGIAIDGAGNVWAANAEANSVSEFSSTGTAITGTNGYGYNNNALSGVAVLAIDGSGNIWLTNPEATGDAANTLTELVGAAAPVVTPKVANLIAPYGTYAVNKP